LQAVVLVVNTTLAQVLVAAVQEDIERLLVHQVPTVVQKTNLILVQEIRTQ
jgi:hypothetical protein